MISYNRGKRRQNYMYVYSYSLRFWGSMDSISDLYQETIFKSPPNSFFSQNLNFCLQKEIYHTLQIYRQYDNKLMIKISEACITRVSSL